MVWIFRLTELIDPAVKITAPQGVYTDVQEFVQRMQSESIDMKQLGADRENEGSDFGRTKRFVYSTVIIEPFQLS